MKDTSEHPDEEIHKARSGRVLRTRASVSMEPAALSDLEAPAILVIPSLLVCVIKFHYTGMIRESMVFSS